MSIRCSSPQPPRLPGYASLDVDVRAGAAADRRPERRRQDEPARGDRAPRLGTVPPHHDRRRARALGRGVRPDRGPGRTRRTGEPSTLEVAFVRAGAGARKRIRVNGVGRRASGLLGALRTVHLRARGDAPRGRLAVPSTLGARPARRATVAGLSRGPGDVRPGAPAAEQPPARDPRGDRGSRRAPVLGRDAPRVGRRRSLPSGCDCSTRLPTRWPAPMPRSPRRRPRTGGWGCGTRPTRRRSAPRRPAKRSPAGWSRPRRRRSGTARRSSVRIATTSSSSWDGRDLADLRLARPAAHRDPRLQARRARPAHRARRPPAAPAARRCVLGARPGAPGAPRPADRRACRRRS